MKYLLVALGLTTMVACKNNDKKIEEDKSVITEKISEYNPELKAEDPEGYNVMVNDTVDDGEMYLGAINYIGLKRDFGSAWFTENYNAHLLDSTSLPELKTLLPEASIKIFMGTWCEDSQREVPALLKILEATNIDSDDVTLIAMTHDKDTPQGFEKDLNIEYVPTILFYKDGKEINRIVEYAQENLEKDMVTILKGEAYKHAYQD
ncbi:MAG: thioredoxin family protein [Bacteroidetes bacterium]|nr:thioredoxin family protein [Bacteroidota bacterium]